MLTPEYLATFAQEYMGYVDILNEEICKDIARRIMKTASMTDTAEWQVRMAVQNGLLIDDVVAEVSKFTTYSDSEIMKMFKDAGLMNIRNDAKALVDAGLISQPNLSGNVLRQLLANAEKTKGDISNLSLTTAVNASQSYMDALNQAIMKVQSGAFSPSEAIKQAIKQCADTGARVQYQHRTMNLDSAIGMCVRTSIAQTCGVMTEQYAHELGAEYYETTAHFDSRLEHVPWQGQVFQIEGSSDEYENFYDATEYGEVTGLCGVNCRHSFFPYFPGVSVRAYTDERLQEMADRQYEYNDVMYDAYTASQMQRNMERNIRATKRELAVVNAALKEEAKDELTTILSSRFTDLSKKLKRQTTKLNDFCSQTGRSNQSARTQVHAAWDAEGNVVYYGRSTAAKASWAARR